MTETEECNEHCKEHHSDNGMGDHREAEVSVSAFDRAEHMLLYQVQAKMRDPDLSAHELMDRVEETARRLMEEQHKRGDDSGGLDAR